MRGRPRRTPTHDARTRQTKLGATDAQSGAVETAGHQAPETADGAQTEPDVAHDEADVAETAQTEPEMAGDEVETGVEGAEDAETALETEVTQTAVEPEDAQPEGETIEASEVPASPGHRRRARLETPARAATLLLRLWPVALQREKALHSGS